MENKRPIIISELKIGMWIYDMHDEEWFKVLGNSTGHIYIRIPKNSDGHTMIALSYTKISGSFTMMAD